MRGIFSRFSVAVATAVLVLAGCAPLPKDDTALPAGLVGKVAVIGEDAPDHARANMPAAVKAEGQGGLVRAVVVRLTEPVTVYRLWSGPQVVNDRGQTNRMGQWWSHDAPSGPRETYRADYEVCRAWNELTWVATCTLRAGAVVAVGPGQSVSEETCGSPGEAYPANARLWQTYVDQAWARPEELDCPDLAADYPNNPADIARPMPAPGAHAAE